MVQQTVMLLFHVRHQPIPLKLKVNSIKNPLLATGSFVKSYALTGLFSAYCQGEIAFIDCVYVTIEKFDYGLHAVIDIAGSRSD